MTTLGTLAQNVYNRLVGSFREEVSSLAANINVPVTTLQLSSVPSQMGVGTVLAIDYEMFYVTAWDPGAKIATVVAGYAGTTPAAHVLGTVTVVNPRFPLVACLKGVTDALRAVPVSIPAVYTTTVSVGNVQYLADLTQADARFTVEAYGLLEALIDMPDDGFIYQQVGVVQPVRWTDYLDARLVKAGGHLLLRLGQGRGMQVLPASMTVTIASPVVVNGAGPTSDLTTLCGLPDSMADVIELGAWLQLLGDQESKRSDRGNLGESRRPEEVPAGLIMSDVTNRRREYNQRLIDEAIKFRAKWPIQVAS